MAKLEPGFVFTGSMGNISVYRMKGSGKMIMRTKGGPSKHEIKTSPGCNPCRENYSEFGGRSKAARYLGLAMGDIRNLKDHNEVSTLQPLMRKIQLMDTTSPRGQRNVCVHLAPHLLQGYSVNRYAHFDSVVRSPLQYRFAEEGLKATVQLPELSSGINFFPHRPHAFFRMMVALGLMPGVYFSRSLYGDPADFTPVDWKGEWHLSEKGCEASTVELELPQVDITDCTLVLSVGICFGSVKEGGVIAQERYSGLGKILGVK